MFEVGEAKSTTVLPIYALKLHLSLHSIKQFAIKQFIIKVEMTSRFTMVWATSFMNELFTIQFV